MNYDQLVVGIEIHLELKIKSKMFCGCSSDYFGKDPNTHTCPVCLGLPGALPFANKEALESCIKIGLALECKLIADRVSRFERKNYFYPDLPKGYQISQYRWPMCQEGEITLSNGKKIGIDRVHIEEDTGKLIHLEGNTAIDFNRSGVPLVEIVTKPDFDSVDEVVEFAKSFHQIVRDLKVSNADMEKGEMRLEANVSLRTKEQKEKGELEDYRVELKNINSFRFMKQAINDEREEQEKVFSENGKPQNQTKGWDSEKQALKLQRSKEDAHDYRYFPEPDIPEFSFSQEEVEKIKSKMGELGSEKAKRLVGDYGISQTASEVLLTQGRADYFEEAIKIADDQFSSQDIANAIVNKRISTEDVSPLEFIEKLRVSKGGSKISDEELEKAIEAVISENQKQVEDYKKGKETVIQYLVGQVMAKTNGQADPNRARQMLQNKLK